MKRFLLVVVVAAAVAFAIWVGTRSKILTGSSNAAVAALLPNNTLALLHVPDFNRSREAWKQTDLYHLWGEAALQEFLQKPLGNVPGSGTRENLLQQIEALGMRDAFIAITGLKDHQPELAAGFRFKGSANAAEEVIGKWRTEAARHAPGVSTSVIKLEGHDVQVMTHGATSIASAYAGQWFLAGNTVDVLKALLDRVDGRSTDVSKTLGHDEHYAAAFKHAPIGYAMFAYARVDQYLQSVAAKVPDAATNPQSHTLGQIHSVAAATTLEEGKIHDFLFVQMPKRSDEGELTRGSLALATKTSFLYFAALLHLPKELPVPDPASANATSWLAKFQQKMAALGATGFSREQFNSAFLSEGSVIGDWPENARLPTLLVSLPVRNFELANRIVAGWTAVADEDRPWTRSSKEGVQYYTLPPANPMLPISPSIAVGKELLVAGFDAASVEAAIMRSSAASSELGSSNRFTAAERQLPAPAQLFSYVDMELLYSRLDAAVRPMLVMAAAFMPGIANKVDLSKLPPPDVITRHLSPVVISQHYENDGYVTESVGPVSVYHALLGIAAASGGAARWYQQDASKRVQGSPSTVPGLSSPSSPSTSPVSDEQQRAETSPDS